MTCGELEHTQKILSVSGFLRGPHPLSLSFPQGTILILMSKRSTAQGHSTRYAHMQKNYCFACGEENPEGMHLKFDYDEARQCFVCHLRLDQRFTGPPGHCHGGIIATILDEAMGKVNRLRDVVAVTSQIAVHYLKPVPLNQALLVESREVSVHGRQHINSAEILDHNRQVLARGEGTFVAIDPEKMFGRFVEK
jgi:uncharacterized protein (TIGR00369 family)